MDEERIDRFTNRPPTPEQARALNAITATMLATDDAIHKLLPPSAERTLALRKLEECSMWAKKAAVFTDDEVLARHAVDAMS